MAAQPLPTFVILGAQKSATRWLRWNLGLHPDVFTASTEIGFFSGAGKFAKGAEWYATQFEGWTGERIVGEATPAYMMYRHDPKVVAARIRSFDQEMRLLARAAEPGGTGALGLRAPPVAGPDRARARASSTTSAARRPRTTGSTSSPAAGTTRSLLPFRAGVR